MDWFDKLKVAIVTKDTNQIKLLTKELPKFESVEELRKAQHLINEAYKQMLTLRDDTSSQLSKIKRSIEFIESTHLDKKQGLDITS
jgi:hypothetical protein